MPCLYSGASLNTPSTRLFTAKSGPRPVHTLHRYLLLSSCKKRSATAASTAHLCAIVNWAKQISCDVSDIISPYAHAVVSTFIFSITACPNRPGIVLFQLTVCHTYSALAVFPPQRISIHRRLVHRFVLCVLCVNCLVAA